jgi:hypothetical protein
MTTPANWTIEQSAYDVIHTMQPSMVETITALLRQGQTPKQITDFIARRDVFLAGIVEMALPVMQAKIAKASDDHTGLLKWAVGKPCGEDKELEPKP